MVTKEQDGEQGSEKIPFFSQPQYPTLHSHGI